MSDKYPGTLLPQDESASENSKAFLDILKKINEVSVQASLNGPSGSNVVKVYDFTTGDQAQSPNDTAFNVIELTGALAGNVNFTLSFNASSLNGRKQYTIINKATTTVFGRYITIKTSVGSLSINIPALFGTYNPSTIYTIYVDVNGNIYTSCENANNTEWVFNTTVTNANDTTSFGYGIGGVLFPPVTTSLKTKRVRFINPYIDYNSVKIEILSPTKSIWLPLECNENGGFAYVSQGTISYGMYMNPVAGSLTDIDVSFATYAQPGTTYNGAGVAWSTYSTYKWRVKKLVIG